MIAATLMVASCSKDDEDTIDNPVVTEEQSSTDGVNNVEPQTKQTRPIVIKAQSGATISKVATTDGYKFTFSDGDKLVLTDGTTTYATLDLASGTGSSTATFSGEISTAADGKSIHATIDGQSVLTEVKTSTTSLADVVQSNCYFKSETFTYNASGELSVTLNDQNAYLVFNVSENQKKVNIGDNWYDVSDGKCYAAVPAGEVTGRFFGTKTAESGKIYTITRTDVVDLGLSVLWCTSNANSPETDQKNWENAKTLANSIEGYSLPTADNFRELTGEKTVDGVTVNKQWNGEGADLEHGYTFSTYYGSVFFPALVSTAATTPATRAATGRESPTTATAPSSCASATATRAWALATLATSTLCGLCVVCRIYTIYIFKIDNFFLKHFVYYENILYICKQNHYTLWVGNVKK